MTAGEQAEYPQTSPTSDRRERCRMDKICTFKSDRMHAVSNNLGMLSASLVSMYSLEADKRITVLIFGTFVLGAIIFGTIFFV